MKPFGGTTFLAQLQSSSDSILRLTCCTEAAGAPTAGKAA